MPGAICTSSHPSAPKLSRICLAACVRIGAVRYSHLVMLGTLLGRGPAAVGPGRLDGGPAGGLHPALRLEPGDALDVRCRPRAALAARRHRDERRLLVATA